MNACVRRRLMAAAASSLALGLALAAPAAADPRLPIDIPAGPLDAALIRLALQTHQQLLYEPGAVAGRQAPALSGAFTPEEALARLLAPSGLQAARTGPRTLVLRRAGTAPASPPAAAQSGGALNADPPPVAAPLEIPAVAANARPPIDPTHVVEEVRVTGTHLHGVTDTPSPVLVMDRAELERSGYATLAGALNTLPQSFGGVSTEGTLTTQTDRLGTNTAYATGINLRGLGADATLVLLNGRRLAGSGNKGDFVDLSTLPSAVVDRVEILLDGASALYGADAVGGVVNIILRRDFEGAETRLYGGAASAGQPGEFQAAQTFGHRWASGNALISYEYDQRTALAASARPYTATADLRPFGGSDWRQTYAYPGNVLRTNPLTGVTSPYWAIPAGQPGVGLSPSSFLAGQVNKTEPHLGVDVLPDQTRHSLYASARQELGDRVEVSADARYGYRAFQLQAGYSTGLLTITPANPFFVSPNGATRNQIAYDFVGDLPPAQAQGSANSLSFSLGADARLGGDWRASAYAAFAQEIDSSFGSGLINTTSLSEALGASPVPAGSAYSPARDGYFNPYGGLAGAVNRPSVLAFIDSGYTWSHSRDRVTSANLQLDGPLAQLPAGALRLAVGADARRESFDSATANFLSGATPTVTAPFAAQRDVLAGFGELRIPLVAPEQSIPGVRRLEASAAGRYEHYSDFGSTLTPKYGVIWSPLEALTLRASYGRSFRAPALRDIHAPALYTTSLFPYGGGQVTSLVLNGGNPDLKPEQATTWTVSLDVTPAVAPGLRLTVSWFDITFQNRIAQPVRQNLLGALTDPALTAFVQRISPTTNAKDLALIQSYLNSPAYLPVPFPATAYGAIVDLRNVNTGFQHVAGVDVTGGYRFQRGADAFGLNLNGSWLYDDSQRFTPTAQILQFAGVAGYPPRLRARATAEWRRDRLGALVALNLQGPMQAPTGERIRGQTTVDAQLRYTAPDTGPLRRFEAVLAVRNLFDRPPPFYDNPAGFAFDPANGDPIGRFVSLQLTQRW